MASFTRLFLETCLDQVKYMEELTQPDRLHQRVRLWTEEEVRANALPQHAWRILEAILYRGELPRGEVSQLLGTSDCHARRVVAALIEKGVVTSKKHTRTIGLIYDLIGHFFAYLNDYCSG